MTARGPAPIQITSEKTELGHRIWTIALKGVQIGTFTNGRDTIACVHRELVAHEAQRRALEAQRKRERNAAMTKAAIKLIGALAANQKNKNR